MSGTAVGPGTVSALQAALAAEHAAVYGYGLMRAYMDSKAETNATA